MTQWSFQPVFDSYLVVLAAAALLIGILAIAPTFRSLNGRRRLILIALRLTLIAMVLLAMLRPTRVSSTTKPQTASLLLLLDTSRSMQLPHESGGRSRWDAQRQMVAAISPALVALAKQLDVKVFAYDRELRPLDFAGGTIVLPQDVTGQQTDIGSSIADAVRQEAGKRVAAVIVCGDGAQTAVEPRVEIYEAARELARLGYPLDTVTFGPSGDAVQARDIAVESIPDHFTVFAKNELSIRGTLKVRGYVNQEIPVQLLLEDSSGKREVIQSRKLTARQDGQQLDLEFSFAPKEPGQFKLTVSAEPQAGELVAQNNRLSAFLTVLEGGIRVLYIEGDLRAEQTFLRQSIDASPDLELDFQWIDSRQRERWPVDLSSLIKGTPYDAYVIGDVDAAALGENGTKLLATEVENGKGLIMLGGYHSFGPGGYGSTSLAEVLPIVMSKLERQNFGERIRADLHHPGPITMLPAREHSIMRLAAGEENIDLWRSLPPLTGANKFAGVKDGAGVQVIARSDRNLPLLVSAEYGRGRVLAFAGDSTWRWWLQGRQTEHKKFWRQAMLWLIRREDLTQNDIWVKLDRRRFPQGMRIAFQAGAKSAAGDVILDATFRAELVAPDGTRKAINTSREGDHILGLIDPLASAGDYTIQVTAARGENSLGTARAEFMVFEQDLELSVSAADHDQMARIALLTKEFGGRPVAPEQLPDLLEELASRPEQFEITVQSKWQLGDTTWDSWASLLLLAGILSTEWFLRKKWGLV